ncbi:MAG: phosphatase PAP2 family protein [Chloroflexota bacterium]|nr:phosphatase PAP2 family protein [Chloroflexota bacterium]
MSTAIEDAQHAVEATGQTVARVRRATAAEVFPPRVALARGRGAATFTAIALAAFALLFALVRRRHSARPDLAITLALQRQRAPWFRGLMQAVSWPGFPPQSRLIPPTLIAAWWSLGFPVEAVFQALGWGATGISFSVKRAMRRPRPDHPQIRVAVARIGGSSFPSGHVLSYMGVYGFLAYALATLIRPRAARRLVVGALTALLAVIGPSRIYLGHHWATDVTASYLLGTSYLLGLTAIYRRVKIRATGR